MENSDIKDIAEQFETKGSVRFVKNFGNGLINKTYLVDTDLQQYVLQNINSDVFADIPSLTRNKVKISEHIRKKHHGNSLEFIPTHQKKYYFKDSKGAYWNMSKLIPNACTFSQVNSVPLAYEAGRAIAQFQSYLVDFDLEEIVDTIPDFHNTTKRINSLKESILSDSFKRVGELSDLIRIAEKYQDFILEMDDKINRNIIPKRIVHNDTKISNILFDAEHKAICMIDLDTCMVGSVLHDFGDALRSGTNTGSEDSPENVAMNFDLFKGYTDGYLSKAKSFLSDLELEYLPFSGVLITYEQFIRFLTDYLNGDVYYKIQHPKHNLQRAKSQAKLLQSMIEQLEAMKRLV